MSIKELLQVIIMLVSYCNISRLYLNILDCLVGQEGVPYTKKNLKKVLYIVGTGAFKLSSFRQKNAKKCSLQVLVKVFLQYRAQKKKIHILYPTLSVEYDICFVISQHGF